MKKNYSEGYKSPQWQKRRLEILSRADFKCELCGCDNEQLHVHHKYYTEGKQVWEYDDKCLIALCESCHSEEHDYSNSLYDMVKSLKELSSKAGLTASDLFYHLHGIEISLELYLKNNQIDYTIEELLSFHNETYTEKRIKRYANK